VAGQTANKGSGAGTAGTHNGGTLAFSFAGLREHTCAQRISLAVHYDRVELDAKLRGTRDLTRGLGIDNLAIDPGACGDDGFAPNCDRP
jgi:hypothetical protein